MILQHLPSTTAAFYSSILGTIALGIATVSTRQLVWNRAAAWALLVGLASFVAVVAFYRALERGPASVVIPLTGLYVIVPAILGFLILHEPLQFKRILGLGFAVLSIVFFSL